MITRIIILPILDDSSIKPFNNNRDNIKWHVSMKVWQWETAGVGALDKRRAHWLLSTIRKALWRLSFSNASFVFSNQKVFICVGAIVYAAHTIVRRTLLVHRVSGGAHLRALCNRAHKPLHWAALEALDARLIVFVLVRVAIVTTRTWLLCAPYKGARSPASPARVFFSRSLHGSLPVFASASSLPLASVSASASPLPLLLLSRLGARLCRTSDSSLPLLCSVRL